MSKWIVIASIGGDNVFSDSFTHHLLARRGSGSEIILKTAHYGNAEGLPWPKWRFSGIKTVQDFLNAVQEAPYFHLSPCDIDQDMLGELSKVSSSLAKHLQDTLEIE